MEDFFTEVLNYFYKATNLFIVLCIDYSLLYVTKGEQNETRLQEGRAQEECGLWLTIFEFGYNRLLEEQEYKGEEGDTTGNWSRDSARGKR